MSKALQRPVSLRKKTLQPLGIHQKLQSQHMVTEIGALYTPRARELTVLSIVQNAATPPIA